MFKLESYITPIILNHVAKYVKNIRPEDSQVSLWEGEVAFQNLDLRLDVLEEELNLPFEFLSGHVHELTILVPWMKITSEPIKITINTIEFVLKLKDAKAEASPSPKRAEVKRTSKLEDGSQPQGYMPGLVNKIINNIVINCHNIILKYVEEDIVVSMNIQLLSFSSADESWKPAFTDIHPVRVFMRKLVQVSDLTICLDKRNAAGQIDVCQEPILYRCSLEVRIIRKYNVNTVHLGSTSRIAIFTKLMEMNVSSLQFPMAMRLFNLILTLKSGDLKAKSPTDVHDDENDMQEGTVSVPQSYLNWAWNLIPSFGTNEFEDDEKVEEETHGQLLDIGIYIQALNFTLKSSEFITDSIVGATKKIRYSPIVKVILGGMYSETVIISDKNWSSTKAGCSTICIEPLEPNRDEECKLDYLVATAPLTHRTFLDRSLFDETFIEKDWMINNIEDYNMRINEEYLLYRSPVIAFDLVEYKEEPDADISDSDVEGNANRNRIIYRVLISTMTLRYNQTYTRIAAIIQDLIAAYDYLPYCADKQETIGGSPKLHPPLLDDFDSLMTGIPLKIYKFNISSIHIEFHPKTEAPSYKSSKKHPVAVKENMPYFRFDIESVYGQWTTPLDPDKLVHTTCQLPDKPIELLNACYNNALIGFKNISINLVQQTDISYKLFNIPKGNINYGDLLQSSLWKNEEVPVRKLDASFESIILQFSKREIIMALRVMKSVTNFDVGIIKLLSQQASINQLETVQIICQFTKLSLEIKEFNTAILFRGSLKSLQSHIVKPDESTTAKHPLLTTTIERPRNKWLEWYLQIPNIWSDDAYTKSVLALWMDTYDLFVDENLVDFLKYMEAELPPAKEPTPEALASTSRVPNAKKSQSERQARRFCYPEETIHVSSERDEKVKLETNREKEMREQFSYSKILPYIKSIVLKVDIAKGMAHITADSSTAQHIHFTEITLPKLLFSSASAEHITRYNVQNEFQNQNGKSSKDTFPWTCGICEFGVNSLVQSTERRVVHPIQTAITIAMTHKKESVSVSKTEHQQQPKVAEETEADKSKQTLPLLSTLPADDSGFSPRSSVEYHRRSINGSSVSGNGRSASPDDNDSRVSDRRRSNLQETVESVFSGRKKYTIRHVVAISLHIDTSPIRMEFNSERTQLLRDHMSLISKIISLMQMTQNAATAQHQDEIQIVTSAEENANIKQFLEMDTNSETSMQSIDKSTSKFIISYLLQWTITKIAIELDASHQSRCKLVLDMEDLISSVDKREDFTKFSSKIGTLNTRFFEIGENNECVLSDRLRIKVQTDSSQSPLFNMIITTVGVKNFFRKIGARRKEVDVCRAISEVIVKMEAIEMIVDMDKLAILAPAIIAFIGTKTAPSTANNVASSPCTASQLPMVHLDSKGFTIYMPIETKKPWCSVSILKVDFIKVSPSLQNPLQRCPVRSDVYQKAAQMGILGTPGSLIEDRQYELSLQNISAASGNWNEILAHMKEHTDNFHNTNPAFEWNNQSRKTSLDLRQVFSNFTFITTYAPYITCNNVLICGQAIEFNCSNDLVASLTTDQVSLFSSIVIKLENIMKPTVNEEVNIIKMTTRKTSSEAILKSTPKPKPILIPSFHSLDTLIDRSHRMSGSLSEKPVTDSGFSSGQRSASKKAISTTSVGSMQADAREMPRTTSFVAGVFIINLYNYTRHIIGIPQGDDPSLVETLTPLITITINQPSFLISQSIYEITKRFSVFNLIVNLYDNKDQVDDYDVIVQKSGIQERPAITLFDTHRGEMDSSGIPPPLVVLKLHSTKAKKLELDLSILKPATVRFSENTIQNLTNYAILYYETLLQSSSFNVRSEKSIFRATKIQMIRNMFFEADRFSLKMDKISLKFSQAEKYNLRINIVDTRLAANFLSRPEKMNAKGSIGGLFIQSNNKAVLHPIGIKCNVDFVQETWNRLPVVTVNVKLNVIRCDVGVEILSNFSDAMKVLNSGMEVSNRLWENFLHRRCDYDVEINRNDLLKVHLPEVERKKAAPPKEEFYQDDLRAGAFQFVEMVSDTFLPMPYQIQIIKKNYGIICWRYPQPRSMSKIHIFPVPMAVPNPIRIKCRMEYFSEAHEGFLHYCDFWLSETVSKSIELPESQTTAHIWRVVILQSLVSINQECFDTSEEDEELRSIISIGIDEILNSAKKESDFILHPKVLVGCMRIDTVFRPIAIPKFQILLNINEIQLNFQNHQNIYAALPDALKKFKISESKKPTNQTFLNISIERTSIHASFHTLRNYSIHSDLTFSIKCLDYGYLNLIYILEPATLSSYYKLNETTVDSNIVADKLSLNVGPSILHNLMCAKENWERYFREEGSKSFLISKFIIANRTYTNLSFGQTGTSERILLKPKECSKYSFISENYDQEITIYTFDGEKEHSSASVAITLDYAANCDSIDKHVPFENKCFVVKTRRLSTTECYILIKAQIELISMVNEIFSLEFYRDEKRDNQADIILDKKDRVSFLQPVSNDSNICIRLKIEGPGGKGQTGNIPLRSNKNYPWLVKVPIASSEKFVSYWVRIIRESIPELETENYHPEKILISIWPIFEIHSMMTCSLLGMESSTKQTFALPPEGKMYQLKVPATHQTDHRISFLKEFNTAPDFNLTLKAIDWNKFFWYDEKVWTVHKTLAELSKPVVLRWPMNNDEQLRARRKCMRNTKTTILYKCFPSREFSCTLRLEVAPWGTFINATGQHVAVHDWNANAIIEITANAVAMLPLIKSEFTLDISNGNTWVSSLPIIFDISIDTSRRKCYRLNENESADIMILRGEQIFKFHLEFCTENERNIFILKPKYVIANMTKHCLAVLPFALDHKESVTRKDITKLAAQKEVIVPKTTTSEYSLGICLDGFFDSNVNQIMRSLDSAFIFFVSIKLEHNSDISVPIALMHPFNRKCFSIQQNASSIPLSASLLEKDGQFFVTIFEDTSPMILLNNQTDLTLIVAQAIYAENNKVVKTIPQYDGRHFEWNQILRQRSIVYYTPPTLYDHFPIVEQPLCNLSIALYNEHHDTNSIKWSTSIHTDESWEKFLHIPSHGDVKVIVCDKHRTIRVSIFYIAQQLEFSVKDLRSRFLMPQSSDSPENPVSTVEFDATRMLNDEPLHRVKHSASSLCMHQSSDPTTVLHTPIKFRFSVNEVNVKIFVECKTLDYLKKEIFALYIDDFHLNYDNSHRKLDLRLSNLQIDNQLFSSGNYDFPVVLCSQELYKRSPSCSNLNHSHCREEDHPKPMAEIAVIFYDDELKMRSVFCRLSPIRTYIEDTYLNDLFDYLMECAPSTVVSFPKQDAFYVDIEPGEYLVPKDIVAQALCISDPLKLQHFQIDSVNVMLSVHTCVRLYIALDHSPLQFSTYERRDLLTLPLRFGHMLGMHYLSGALFGAGWVVGSLEMLGSPSGLARSFSVGLKDFISMPAQGLLRGPWGFVVGVTQGSASLLRNITAGTVNSVSKLAASVSRNLDRLTLDPEHIERTEALRRCRPQGFTEGFTQGITGLGISILGAVGGIARHALEARSPGQVVTGMGKGIFGAFAKPISGAAELLALTGQGMLHTVGFNAMPQQRAPSIPRNIAAQAAEERIWNVLLSILSSVLDKDQILFYHQVTLVEDEKLRSGCVFLTSTILALYETDSNSFSFISPVRTLDVSVDPEDKTLLYLRTKKQHEDDTTYTNQRIMAFLNNSSHHLETTMTADSLDDIINRDTQHKIHSFYISENLGQYLIEYLRILNMQLS